MLVEVFTEVRNRDLVLRDQKLLPEISHRPLLRKVSFRHPTFGSEIRIEIPSELPAKLQVEIPFESSAEIPLELLAELLPELVQ